MSQIIQSYNQEIQNSLTRRIILYLRKLSFLKFLTPSNLASMNEKCQNCGSTSVSKNVTNHRIFQPSKSELFDTKNRSSITLSQKTLVHTMSEKNDTSQFQPWKSELFDTKNHSSITLSQKTVICT